MVSYISDGYMVRFSTVYVAIEEREQQLYTGFPRSGRIWKGFGILIKIQGP
jgi:hypothetical protein